MLNFSIDRGGTFTDIYAEDGKRYYTLKLLSENPEQYEDAPREGICRIIEQYTETQIDRKNIPETYISSIRMGTTVATNAFLEKKGSNFAFLVTGGFRDLLEIRYQNRKNLFKLHIEKIPVLYKRVIEVEERVLIKNGKAEVLIPLQLEPLKTELISLKKEGIHKLAVSFMHSYEYNEHEKLVYRLAESLGFEQISLSSEISPNIKIVERADITCIDVYLSPIIKTYIENFKKGFSNGLKHIPLLFMQSNGGLIDERFFRGYNSILSGPAGGYIGYSHIFQNKALIGFDMGGTSTDVSRYAGQIELSDEINISGVRVNFPSVDIQTVAAGGGSRLFYKNSMFLVGPESSGANPGPVCYGKGGYLSVTDANLILRRIIPEFFPKIFGPSGKEALSYELSYKAFEELAKEINLEQRKQGNPDLSIEEIALGFINVANYNMIKPIQEISTLRGYNIKEHVLCCFGGAASQHAVAIARNLGMKEIFIHRYAGILSAIGLSQADIVKTSSRPKYRLFGPCIYPVLNKEFELLEKREEKELRMYGNIRILRERYVSLQYEGTESAFLLPYMNYETLIENYHKEHERTYGYRSEEKNLFINEIRLILRIKLDKPEREKLQMPYRELEPKGNSLIYFKNSYIQTSIYMVQELSVGSVISGPVLLVDKNTTVLIEPGSTASVNEYGDIHIVLDREEELEITEAYHPVHLTIFHNLFSSIASQMGKVLQKTAVSTNIKERLDYSCALFDSEGNLVANAPHVPVHLGSMSFCVKSIIQKFSDISEGDVFITNVPDEGGSHLPDITLISPYFSSGKVAFFLASRGHHADIGGIYPGSMPPFSKKLKEEGARIRAFKILEKGNYHEGILISILQQAGARKIKENIADVKAQVASIKAGESLLKEMIHKYGPAVLRAYALHIQNISENKLREFFKHLDKNEYAASDFLDDGTLIDLNIKIDRVIGEAVFDFSNSGPEQFGNQNTPLAVTYSALVYVLRCIINEELPLNEGFIKPIRVITASNTILSPSKNRAIVGGNVSTSQRIVDVVLQAFGLLACSGGCMNNVSFGNDKFGYYETIGVGSGAGKGFSGASGVHTHMTNTRITDPEII
ncbi:MAG: hydantoinase B/oxoprolinase family protein, partial [Leptospiraceae bacterium]|nr:hydantoinase B/oxoprolinase family protein [Leptospiraceae bacterium]